MVSPGPQAGRIFAWLLARGFKRHGGHSMLLRPCGRPVAAERLDVRVLRAGREHMAAVIAINERCFAIPASRRGWTRAAMRAPGLEQYVALVGRTPVASAALRIDGDLAWLGMGATLTRWRRHGAHAALIAARLRRAARKGCRWVSVETTIPEPGRPAGSRRNLLRAGFEEAGEKPVFVWQER
jgi:GNAT superfamily N-acetyltransferase